MNLEVCKKIVESGESKVFNNWKTLAPITKENFLEALSWLSEDPLNGGASKTRATREIGLTPDGIVKLKRNYMKEDICVFYGQDGFFWGGAIFHIPCDNPDFADSDGTIPTNLKLCLSCMDRI